MNYRMILFIIGKILGTEAALMLLPLATALIYKENILPFVITQLILIALSVILSIKQPKDKSMRSKDGFVCVGLSWIALASFGALPFTISGEIPSYINALFETVSGFTTTGSSILTDVEVVSRGLTLWRSFSHWVGGMGVLVFVLAVMPRTDMKSGRFMHLMRAESPGPSVGKLVPRLADTARVMYGIYIALTVVLMIFLLFGGMNLFETLCHSFGVAGTGGFGIKNDSIASYSPYCQYVMATFMIIFGVNFNIYYFILIGQFLRTLKSEELRWYFAIVVTAVTTICVSFYLPFSNDTLRGEEAFRVAYFQVASIISTSGFTTADFNLWNSLSQAVLVVLMFSGACAGSTAGGIKVSRLILLAKNAAREVKYIINPRSVHSVKFDKKTVDSDTIRGTTSFIIVYFFIFAFSVLGITIAEGCDLVSSFTAVAACLNNIGPGLSLVGPASNFGWMSNFSKILLSFDMLAGRLEIFPIIILFSPATWKKSV